MTNLGHTGKSGAIHTRVKSCALLVQCLSTAIIVWGQSTVVSRGLHSGHKSSELSRMFNKGSLKAILKKWNYCRLEMIFLFITSFVNPAAGFFEQAPMDKWLLYTITWLTPWQESRAVKWRMTHVYDIGNDVKWCSNGFWKPSWMLFGSLGCICYRFICWIMWSMTWSALNDWEILMLGRFECFTASAVVCPHIRRTTTHLEE